MTNAYLLRANPSDNRRLVDQWIEKGLIAIGWGATGDLGGKSQSAIRDMLESAYQYAGAELSKSLSACNLLVNRIKPDDYVLVPDPDDLQKIYVFIVEGDYFYSAEAAGWPHQRKARYVRELERYRLSPPLQSKCRTRRTAIALTGNAEEIRAQLEQALPDASPVRTFEARFPLRLGAEAVLSLPADMTPAEAERLAGYIRLLCLTEQAD